MSLGLGTDLVGAKHLHWSPGDIQSSKCGAEGKMNGQLKGAGGREGAGLGRSGCAPEPH